MAFVGTFWALVPALIAIILALITKEVYSSLFIGIIIGALFATSFDPVAAFDQVVNEGLIKVLSDPYNVGILIFLVVLGAMVSLLNKSGGSKAFGEWASKNIKTKAGALLATWFFGVLIFVDDYFNCLTVGSVMRPVTDKYKISRAKLAYIIDATAAPICIIAPISSWAAAVTGFVEGEDGLALFIKAIPYNYYALLTMVFIIATTILGINFGKMKKCEDAANSGNLFYGEQVISRETAYHEEKISGPGKVIDLIIPIITLVVFCVVGLIYSGGFFDQSTEGYKNFIIAFSNADASVGLAMGSIFALILTIIYYLVKRLLNFSDTMSSLTEGFKNMVPAILILTLAWTLKEMIDSLEATTFIDSIVRENVESMSTLLPAVIFLLGSGISFATGTSWGTFGILIPIVVYVLKAIDPQLMIIGISAAMAGSVFGDHCSPISDTTIMSSAGAQCEHLLHVSTQLSYAGYVAIVSFICYIIAGIVRNPFVPLVVGIIVLIAGLFALKNIPTKETNS